SPMAASAWPAAWVSDPSQSRGVERRGKRWMSTIPERAIQAGVAKPCAPPVWWGQSDASQSEPSSRFREVGIMGLEVAFLGITLLLSGPAEGPCVTAAEFQGWFEAAKRGTLHIPAPVARRARRFRYVFVGG